MSTTKKKSGGGLLSRIKRGAKSLRSGLKRRRQRGKEKRATVRGRRAKAKRDLAQAGVEQLETTKSDLEEQLRDPNLTPDERLLLRTQLQEVNRELTRGRFFVSKQSLKQSRAKKKKLKARGKLGIPPKTAGATALTPASGVQPPRDNQLPMETPESPLEDVTTETEEQKSSRIENRINELVGECDELKEVLSHVDAKLSQDGPYETKKEWYDVKKLVLSHLQEKLKKIECKTCKHSKNKKRWYDRRKGVYPSSFVTASASIQCKTGDCGATATATRDGGYTGMMVLDMKTGKFVPVE